MYKFKIGYFEYIADEDYKLIEDRFKDLFIYRTPEETKADLEIVEKETYNGCHPPVYYRRNEETRRLFSLCREFDQTYPQVTRWYASGASGFQALKALED